MADEKADDKITEVSSVEPDQADGPTAVAAALEAESVAESPAEPAAVSTDPAAEPAAASTDVPAEAAAVSTAAAAEAAAPATAGQASAAPVESNTPPDSPPAGRQFGGLSLIAAGLVGLLAVVACAFAVVFGVKYYDQKDTDDNHNSAQQFVCTFAKSLVTYDFNNLDQFFDNMLNETTGTLQAQFTGQQAQAVKQRVISSQTKSTANEANCGVVIGDGNHARVLVSLTQNVTSAGTQGQTVEMPPAAMLISTTKVGGQWKASDLQGVGLPQQ